MKAKTHQAYLLALAGWFLLFILLCWNIIGPHSTNELPRSIQLLFLPGPLLLFLRGLLNGKPKTHLFASIVALIYFSMGVINLFEASARNYGALQIVFSLMLFTGGVLYARWGSQLLKLRTQSASSN